MPHWLRPRVGGCPPSTCPLLPRQKSEHSPWCSAEEVLEGPWDQRCLTWHWECHCLVTPVPPKIHHWHSGYCRKRPGHQLQSALSSFLSILPKYRRQCPIPREVSRHTVTEGLKHVPGSNGVESPKPGTFELLFLLPKDESLAWLALICEQPLIPQGKFQSLPPAEERKRGREKDNS